MINLEIRRLYLYKETITEDQHIDFHVLGLLLEGDVKAWVNGSRLRCPAPRAYIAAAGDHRKTESNGQRIAWGFSFHSADLRRNPSGIIQLREEDHWMDIPEYIALKGAPLRIWKNTFEQMHQLIKSPDLINHFKAKTLLLQLFAYFLSERSSEPQSPAHALKRMIDAQTAWDQNLNEMCDACGYSPSRLRHLFHKEFGIAPKVYIERCKMDRAFELIINSQLSVKDIAHLLGYKQVSHLSASFKQAHGYPPSEAIKRYRHGHNADSRT